MGNCPNTDILCSNIEGTRFVHIQVKTYTPGSTSCIVGPKAMIDFGNKFFWVLVGLPKPAQDTPIEYYIIPSSVMAKNVPPAHKAWLKKPKKAGEKRSSRTPVGVRIPPITNRLGWSIKRYRDRWDIIEKKLRI
jgi:hypothetical protein